MSNFEKIKSMSIDELASWMDENCAFDDSEMVKNFDENYCNKCDGVMGEITWGDGEKREVEMGWCEKHGRCKYFEDKEGIPEFKEMCKLWLMEEVKK